MSGIAGIIRFDGAPVEPGLIESMTAAMAHRGPDGISHWVDNSVALGHCMLRTTPESFEEQQPTVSRSGDVVLIMDGRIDNWLAVRSELLSHGCNLRNKSDAELVLNAYSKWGMEFVSKLEGDFAIVLWLAHEKRIVCFRDPMGIKPFNYFWNGRIFAFASEIQAILELPDVPQSLDTGTLAQFLASEWHTPQDTFWVGISRLKSGYYLDLKADSKLLRRYWEPEPQKTLRYKREEEYVEHYRELLNDTVRRMSRSHKPISCEVSGGLDSSALFAVAENLRRAGSLTAPDVFGYTLNFEGDPRADEIAYCRAVGHMLGKAINEVAPAHPPLSRYRDIALKYREFPGYPNAMMADNLMHEVKLSGSRVLLDGVGGDEWLNFGRTYYREALDHKQFMRLTNLLLRDLKSEKNLAPLLACFRSLIGWMLPQRALEFVQLLQGYPAEKLAVSDWLSKDLQQVLAQKRREHRSALDNEFDPTIPNAFKYTLYDPYKAIVHEQSDRYASEFGFESRRPFYNIKMVEFSLMVPHELLFANGIGKHLHRRAMKGLLPEAVLKRNTEAEFSSVYLTHLPYCAERVLRPASTHELSWVQHSHLKRIHQGISSSSNAGVCASIFWGLLGCEMVVQESFQG